MRYINAPLEIFFEIHSDQEEFKREYDSLSSTDDDTIGEWLRLAKARGSTEESDQVLLTLIVELHRKIDKMDTFLRGKKQTFLTLESKGDIEAINHEHFRLKDEILQKNESYYGRIEMPFFPKREVPIYFKSIGGKEGKITLLHERDRIDWDAYVVARERVMIREMRLKKDGN